jgi:Carboxypeptidase regulatory-like domain
MTAMAAWTTPRPIGRETPRTPEAALRSITPRVIVHTDPAPRWVRCLRWRYRRSLLSERKRLCLHHPRPVTSNLLHARSPRAVLPLKSKTRRHFLKKCVMRVRPRSLPRRAFEFELQRENDVSIEFCSVKSAKCLLAALLMPVYLYAADVGSVRGIVHDSQHLPIAQADVRLKSATSDWVQYSKTDSRGEFAFMTVPLGDYVLTVSQIDYVPAAQAVTVTSGSTPIATCSLPRGRRSPPSS